MRIDDIKKLSDERLSILYHAFKDEYKSRKRKNITIRRKTQKEISSLKRIREKKNIIDLCKPENGIPFKPIPANCHYSNFTQYLRYLYAQDWSFLFKNDCYDEEKKYYVYAHVDPEKIMTSFKLGGKTSGIPFYIGKGSGNRAYDLKRNQGHGLKIRELIRKGYSDNDIVYIIKNGLTESESLELESKLIYYFGRIYDEKRRNGILLNLDKGLTPTFGERLFIVRKNSAEQNSNESNIGEN